MGQSLFTVNFRKKGTQKTVLDMPQRRIWAIWPAGVTGRQMRLPYYSLIHIVHYLEECMADLLKVQARHFRDLGHPMRLQILCLLLREGRQCVCRMLDEVRVPQPTLSRHLAVLRDHGLIEDEREGVMVFYRVADPRVREIFRAAGLPCGCAAKPRKSKNSSGEAA